MDSSLEKQNSNECHHCPARKTCKLFLQLPSPQFVSQAAEGAVISSLGAEVWRIDPSDGSLFVVTRRLPAAMDLLGYARVDGPKHRVLNVEVASAELSPAMEGVVHNSTILDDILRVFGWMLKTQQILHEYIQRLLYE